MFSQCANLVLPEQVEAVTLHIAKISVGKQTGEVEIRWPVITLTEKLVEFAKEHFQKGKSKKVFRVCVIILNVLV